MIQGSGIFSRIAEKQMHKKWENDRETAGI